MYEYVRAMDDVLEENLDNHALPEQKEMALKYRNVGIGIMGFHDALLAMGIKYGSPESITIAYNLMQNLFAFALDSSVRLGIERGNFPGYDDKIWDSIIIKNNIPEAMIESYKTAKRLRNCSLLSIAPTGSIATMLNVSTGVEPLFATTYTRKTESLGGETQYHQVEVPIIAKIKELSFHPESIVTSHDINWKDRLAIQAALQRACDTAISSTINLPESTTVEEMRNIFIEAWRFGLKGVTVFRNNCARIGVLTTKESKQKDSSVTFDSITPVSRKKMGVTKGYTFCKKCACGTLYITVNKDVDDNLVEVFTHTSKGGICQANLNGETRMLSLALRSGVKVDEIIDQLKGITCPACTAVKAKGGKVDGISCADIIAKTIEEFQKKKDVSTLEHTKDDKNSSNQTEKVEYEECPECHQKTLIREAGCQSCTSCGYSKCN